LLKPADLISVLNNLWPLDVLFIDEIHRLKPQLEEILYTAMEDRVVDMILPDGSSMRLPLQPFNLIWATTKPEKLSAPLKNRFVYKFHLVDYTIEEKHQIIVRYFEHYSITYDDEVLVRAWVKVLNVPREIFNTVTKIRDYLVWNQLWNHITCLIWNNIDGWIDIDEWWITPLQNLYLDLLKDAEYPLWVSTIAARLWVEGEYIEHDIEPLLMKLWYIVKTPKWRVYVW
jgi:Holliday junction DNA helicase RuvB